MDYFPIFLRLKGQPVLVVGGGDVAARKVALLLRAGARVTVVAPELGHVLAQRLADEQISYLSAQFDPTQLDGMRLVIAATDQRAVNAWVAHQAARRNVPANVVDDRELSGFIMPAIVDRSPVIVAVGSSGDAPVLTRRLRERLETLLPQRLGDLARLAGQLRGKVKARLKDASTRRRFWEHFFDGELGADVLTGRQSTQDESLAGRVSASLGRFASQGSFPGEVVLVGAGPGDPELLTLRGLRALQDADVVLHDKLVSAEVLDLARRDAELIDVGKQAGGASMSQQQINALLISLARQGRRVCRLKGGDPFIFGRGGEELQALAAAGIRFEVVPGITAAAGCAAYAGIPLTHRDHAQALTFVTGHGRDDEQPSAALNWAQLARPGQTVVFYMGLKNLPDILGRLREHGASASLPAALVAHGTRRDQQVVTGTLSDLAERSAQAGIGSPALLIVGEVAALHQTLQWFNVRAEGTAGAGRLIA